MRSGATTDGPICALKHSRSSTRSSNSSRSCGGIFDWDKATARLASLNATVEDPGLWAILCALRSFFASCSTSAMPLA